MPLIGWRDCSIADTAMISEFEIIWFYECPIIHFVIRPIPAVGNSIQIFNIG